METGGSDVSWLGKLGVCSTTSSREAVFGWSDSESLNDAAMCRSCVEACEAHRQGMPPIELFTCSEIIPGCIYRDASKSSTKSPPNLASVSEVLLMEV